MLPEKVQKWSNAGRALRRALQTPPKPKQDSVKRKDKPKKEKPAK